MDNRSYFLDETLWYKAYVVDSDSNKLTKASEILHIELLSPEGAVIRTQKQRLIEGQCDGYFALDSALYSGYFEIRAYTKAMLNYDEQNYFSRVFPLFEKPNNIGELDSIRRTLPRYRTVGELKTEKEKDKDIRNADRTPNYSVNFYPEGGNLVMDIESKVTFQVKDSDGKVVNKKCYLWNRKNKCVDSTYSTHLGIGTLKITPNRKENELYLTIKDDAKNNRFVLPDVLKRGYILNVDNLSDSLNLKIKVTSTEILENLGIAILSRGCTQFCDSIMPTKNNLVSEFKVDKTTLRDGVNQVVLYDGQGRELASRMIFIRNNNMDNILTIDATIKSDSNTLIPYQRQNILFNVKDSNGDAVETTFSLSIRDSSSIDPTFNRDDIYTNLLLSSEVKGFIPNVDYYFEANNIERNTNLDLLLQVYGWSRYKWEYLSGYQDMDTPYFMEKNLIIFGMVYGQRWYSDAEGYSPSDKIMRLRGTRGILLTHIHDESLLYHEDREKGTSLFWHKDQFPSHPCPVREGQFHMNIGDFYGETKFLLSSRDSKINGIKAMSDHLYPFFLIESESSPEEKSYDFFEINIPKKQALSYAIINGEYISQYNIDEIDINERNVRVFHPAIKTKYYNQGFYSEIYPAFKRPILDRVNNRGLSSLREFAKSFDIDKYRGRTVPKTRSRNNNNDSDLRDAFWARSRHIEYPTEYLKYHKLPLGSFAFISNTTVDTTDIAGDCSYYTIPLKHETLDINDYDLDPSKYTCFIDSTIIHTDYNTIENFHNKFKTHSKYQQYDIKNTDDTPSKTSSKERPTYIVEHFCRIIKQEAKRDDVLELVGRDLAVLGHDVLDIAKVKQLIRKNHYSDKDLTKRAIIFQGLTRMDKEFYSPDYNKTPLPTQGDYRRTLYWNPNVQTDSTGCASVEFYNNSSCTKYYIDAQTVTRKGEMGILNK